MIIEQYFQHMPDCACLCDTDGKVPCSCGRDAAVAEVRRAITENILIRQAFANLHLTVFHIGPVC